MRRLTSDAWLGIFFLAIGLVILFIWIPLDTDSGLLEKVRRTTTIGDALAPSIACVILATSGMWLAISSVGKSSTIFNVSPGFVFGILAILSFSLLLMRWSGPLIIDEYRVLRDTLPWKLVGYVLGGTFLIFSLISIVEKRLSAIRLFLAIAITLAIGLIYDLPFEDLLLPPNGDV